MKIDFACEFCGKPHSVDAALAGRKGRCKDCGNVMEIPASSATTTKPESRPAIEGADDPYGLDDAPAAATIRPDMATGDAPLPRARVGKERRAVDQGPWGLRLRGLAVNATVLVFIAWFARVLLEYQPATREAARTAGTIQFLLAVAASSLTAASVVGAAVSRARGNRKAFSGESFQGQGLWWYAQGQTIVIALFLAQAATPGGRARMIAAGRSPSAVAMADLSVYEDVVGTVVASVDELAAFWERFPDVDPEVDPARLLELQRRFADVSARAEATPLPTREQAKSLRARFDAHAREVADRLAAASRKAADALKNDVLAVIGDQTKIQDTMRGLERSTAEAVGMREALDRLGPSDDLAWYLTLAGKQAGTRVGSAAAPANPAPHFGPAPGPNLASQPRGTPPEVRGRIEDSRRRLQEMRRAHGFPGPRRLPETH